MATIAIHVMRCNSCLYVKASGGGGLQDGRRRMWLWMWRRPARARCNVPEMGVGGGVPARLS
jgi:hypothetical protein